MNREEFLATRRNLYTAAGYIGTEAEKSIDNLFFDVMYQKISAIIDDLEEFGEVKKYLDNNKNILRKLRNSRKIKHDLLTIKEIKEGGFLYEKI